MIIIIIFMRLEMIAAAHLTLVLAFLGAQFLGRSSSSHTLMMSWNYSIVTVSSTIFSLTTSKCPPPFQLSPVAAASACHLASMSYQNGVHHARDTTGMGARPACSRPRPVFLEAKAKAKSLRGQDQGQGRPSGLRGQGQDSPRPRPRPVVFEANDKRYVQGTSNLLPLDVNIFS